MSLFEHSEKFRLHCLILLGFPVEPGTYRLLNAFGPPEGLLLSQRVMSAEKRVPDAWDDDWVENADVCHCTSGRSDVGGHSH